MNPVVAFGVGANNAESRLWPFTSTGENMYRCTTITVAPNGMTPNLTTR